MNGGELEMAAVDLDVLDEDLWQDASSFIVELTGTGILPWFLKDIYYSKFSEKLTLICLWKVLVYPQFIISKIIQITDLKKKKIQNLCTVPLTVGF